MNLIDQLRVMANTDILVGVHGAGLTHALFMKPQTVLIELAPPSHQSFNFFQTIAQANGIHYIRQIDGISGTDDQLTIDVSTHTKPLLEALLHFKEFKL
jgi:capsular polysaccharide biosynthesis protein